jgi:hypothetical protein
MSKNIRELRKELCKIFNDLRSGELAAKDAKEMNNAAGKIIGTLKVELEYAALRQERPEIEFLFPIDEIESQEFNPVKKRSK